VLYELVSQEDLDKISHKEGVKQGHYSLKKVFVKTDMFSQYVEAFAYIAYGKSLTADKSLKPTQVYLDKLLDGKDYLPSYYVEKLRMVEVKEGDKHLIDEERKPLTLKQIQKIIKNKQFDKFYRSEKVQKKYDEVKGQSDFLKNLKNELEKEIKGSRQRWVIRKNSYPYYFEKGLEHWIAWDFRCPYNDNQDWRWTKVDFAQALLNKSSSITYPFKGCLWWVNPHKHRSVNNIPHVHLVKKLN
jgi:hypothetical protein